MAGIIGPVPDEAPVVTSSQCVPWHGAEELGFYFKILGADTNGLCQRMAFWIVWLLRWLTADILTLIGILSDFKIETMRHSDIVNIIVNRECEDCMR